MSTRTKVVMAVLLLWIASDPLPAQAAVLAQEDTTGIVGAIIDGLQWLFDATLGTLWGWISSLAGWIADEISAVFQELLCKFRKAAANAIGWPFCVECVSAAQDDGEGMGSEIVECHVIQGCTCAVCIGSYVADYKHLVANALMGAVGTTNVFAKFLPWKLWAFLTGAYILICITVWAVKQAMKFASMIAGAFG